MAGVKLHTAERVSRDASDNFVFQRSVLAYCEAARRVGGRVLEIGTGTGYGVEIVAPHAESFVTMDKHRAEGLQLPANTQFIRGVVPPLPFGDGEFDCVISFQVIEHIRCDRLFVAEVCRVLRPGGMFIVTTPNAPMSLTRNPWHVREYTAGELSALLGECFGSVEMYGVCGNDRIAEYYGKNREGVRRITRFDPLDLQHRLPAWMLRLPYDILNRLNRRRLLARNDSLTNSITMDDYRLDPHAEAGYDLFCIARKA